MIYLAGPISGTNDYNQRFKSWVEKLVAADLINVVNPVELDHAGARCWWDYMRTDIKALRKCKYIFFQPRWWLAKGCWIEWAFSKVWGIKRIKKV